MKKLLLLLFALFFLVSCGTISEMQQKGSKKYKKVDIKVFSTDEKSE